MNDFTKEELQYIYDGLLMLSNLGWRKSDLTFCKKISDMIDNYCEHESNKQGCIKVNGKKLTVCSKCGEFFNDNQ